MSWPQCIMTSPALPLWQCHHSTPQTLPASRCTCGHMVSKKWSKIKFQAYSTDFTHKKEKTQQTPGEYNQERVGFFQLFFFLAYPLTKIPQNSKLAKKSRMSQQPLIKQPHLSVSTWEPVLANVNSVSQTAGGQVSSLPLWPDASKPRSGSSNRVCTCHWWRKNHYGEGQETPSARYCVRKHTMPQHRLVVPRHLPAPL